MIRICLLALTLLVVVTPARAGGDACVAAGGWFDPAGGAPVTADAVLERAAAGAVVLLGEVHDNPDHHRWQLQTMAALLGRGRALVLGFEMFPRRVQPVLDRWVAGEFDEAGFLEAVGWNEVWGFDAALYMPLFHFARINRLAMVALNVDRALIDRVGNVGWDAVADDRRDGVGDPAPPAPAYVALLLEVFREHQAMRRGHGEDSDEAAAVTADDPAFRRFMDVQLTWDRAMAEALAGAAGADGRPLVVAVIGAGHLEGGYGVSHQLAALGVADSTVLLPWDRGRDCAELTPGLARAVFGMAPAAVAAVAAVPDRPRLGVMIDGIDGRLTVMAVSPDSIAEATAIAAGDIIVEAAGLAMAEPADLIAVIQRQAPGTWLPLVVERDGERLDLIARFPATGP
jgi:uncharacterized iron-regulated protein